MTLANGLFGALRSPVGLGVRTSAMSVVVALALLLGTHAEAPAEIALADLQWAVQNIVDNDDAPFGIGQGPGAGEPRSVRGLALSPDGQYLYLGYNQHKQIRKIDLSVGDPADSCAVIAEVHFGTSCLAGGYTGTCQPDALDNPKALATDDTGRVWATRSSEIQVFDADLTVLLLSITGFSATNGVHVARRDASSFYVYAADRGLDEVYRMIVDETTISGGGSVTRASVLDPAFDSDGIVNVGLDSAGASSDDLRGLASDADGNVWAGENDGTLFLISPDGSTVAKRALAGAFDVAIDGDQVFVSTSGRTVTVIDRNDIDTVIATLTPPLASFLLEPAVGTATGVDLLSANAVFVAIEGGSSAPQGSESSFSDVDCSGPDPNPVADDDNDQVLVAQVCPTTRYVTLAGSDALNDCRDPGTPCATIQHAIDVACPSGDTISLSAETFAEGPQIVVDKSVSLVGAGKTATVIGATGNTGGSGDARGWFLVLGGITFNVSELTLDGSGFNIHQAIRYLGQGEIDNVQFNEIKYPSYAGMAVAVLGSGPVDVSNSMFSEIGRIGVIYFGAGASGSTFSDNMYVGKGDGDHLDYMVEVGAGAEVTISGSSATENRGQAASDGSTSAGILVTTFFGAGTSATIDGNTLEDNTTGIAIGFNDSDTSTVTATCNRILNNLQTGTCDVGVTNTCLTGAVGSACVADPDCDVGGGFSIRGADAGVNPIVIHENSLAGNLAGIRASNVQAGTVDAEDNWWGAVDGPSGAGTGSGDSVSVNVDFDPFATFVPACVDCSDDAQCDDGLGCTGTETCNLGTGMCEMGTAVVCSGPCLTGVCLEPAGTCEPEPDTTPCDSGADTCSEGDECQSGVCSNTGGGGDSDVDSICDLDDNCPAHANSDQADADLDEIGDVCDADTTPHSLVVSVARLRQDTSDVRDNGTVRLRMLMNDNDTLGGLEASALAGTVSVRVVDSGGFDVTLPLSGCTLRGLKKRIVCLSNDRKIRAVFRPTRQGPHIYNGRVVGRQLSDAVTGASPSAGPVTVTVEHATTADPLTPTITRVDDISDCTARGAGLFKLTCIER